MSLPALPIFVKVAGRAVILVGEGEAADAKRRLLERAGAIVVPEVANTTPTPFIPSAVEGHGQTPPQGVSTALDTNGLSSEGVARLAIVAIEDDGEAEATVARLKARGILVNAVDRPDLCDFTLPAIVDRAPVIVAIGTGGASAGLAAALRQRLEALIPASLGALAERLFAARGMIREKWPDAGSRRHALGDALAEGGVLDPLHGDHDVEAWLTQDRAQTPQLREITLRSADPDDLTLGEARALALADRVYHAPDVQPAILDRARADASRIRCTAPPRGLASGLSVFLSLPPSREG